MNEGRESLLSARSFRKKPVLVEAMRYTRDSRDAVIAWCGAQGTAIDEDGCAYELERIRIGTLEGTMAADLGDWIIRGVAGEFYPCKPDIFEATYEDVDTLRDLAFKALDRLAVALGVEARP